MHSTAKAWGNQRRMRARSIRGTPMAGLVPPHHAGAAGPCRARHPAGARQKKHLKIRCRSVCRRSAGYCAASYGAALTPSSTCWPGRHGGAGTSTAPSSVTTGAAAAYLLLCFIYGCSTSVRDAGSCSTPINSSSIPVSSSIDSVFVWMTRSGESGRS